MNVLTHGVGAGGESASIFATGPDENSIVTATKDGKVLQGKWTQKPNPEYPDLPEGYAPLEYIENNAGAAYIELPASLLSGASTVQVNAKVSLSQVTSGRQFLFTCGTDSYSHYMEVAADGSIGQYGLSIAPCVAGKVYDVSMTIEGASKTTVTVDGKSAFTNQYQGAVYTPIRLFQLTGSLVGQYVRVHYYELLKNGNVVAKLYPVKRTSDSVLGMYDATNKAFYANAGSGEFVAGAEISQYVYGFEIAPIKKYGMWTVAATNGEDTTTQDVLVDAAIEFEIELSYAA